MCKYVFYGRVKHPSLKKVVASLPRTLSMSYPAGLTAFAFGLPGPEQRSKLDQICRERLRFRNGSYAPNFGSHNPIHKQQNDFRMLIDLRNDMYFSQEQLEALVDRDPSDERVFGKGDLNALFPPPPLPTLPCFTFVGGAVVIGVIVVDV